MKLNSKELIFGAIGVVIIVILGLILWQNHENNPQVQAEKASKAASKSSENATNQYANDLKNAPEGNYVHLTKEDDTLYRTDWSKEKMIHFTKTDDGNKPTTFGTKHKFNAEVVADLINPENNDAYTYTFEDSLDGTDTNNGDGYTAYFNSLADAKKDKYVKQNVNHIVY